MARSMSACAGSEGGSGEVGRRSAENRPGRSATCRWPDQPATDVPSAPCRPVTGAGCVQIVSANCVGWARVALRQDSRKSAYSLDDLIGEMVRAPIPVRLEPARDLLRRAARGSFSRSSSPGEVTGEGPVSAAFLAFRRSLRPSAQGIPASRWRACPNRDLPRPPGRRAWRVARRSPVPGGREK